MQSYSRQTLGKLTSNTSTILGSTSSSTDTVASSKDLTVVNGNIQGDKKVPNPITFSRVVKDFGYSTTRLESIAYGSKSYQDIRGPSQFAQGSSTSPMLGTVDFGRTSDRAIEKVYNKLRGNSNLIVDIAEGHQTIAMLKKTLLFQTLAGNFFKNIEKSRRYRRFPKNTTGDQRKLDWVTNKWLEYRYGWTPLVHSIYDAADNMLKDLRGGLINLKGRSGAKIEGAFVRLQGDGSYSDPFIEVSGNLYWRTEYSCLFRVPSGANLADWTSLNPLGIAWELLPLSFVADWFVNVSQQLSLWENLVLYNKHFLGGYRTDSYLEETSWSRYGVTRQPWVYAPNGVNLISGSYSGISQHYKKRLSFKDRQVLVNLPIPAGVRLDVNLNAKRMLDATGLIHQLFARKMRALQPLLK